MPSPVQTRRMLVAGKSGSGKSVHARKIIGDAMTRGKTEQLIIVNRKDELKDLCERRVIVRDEPQDSSTIAGKINSARSVFFYVVAQDPRPFMDQLGFALMERKGARLVVIEEANQLARRGQIKQGWYRVNTEGRHLLLSALYVSPEISSASGGIDGSIMEQLTDLTAFHTIGTRNLERLYEKFPEIKGQAEKFDLPGRLNMPEYAVRDMNTGEAYVVLNTRKDKRKRATRRWHDITAKATGTAFAELVS